MKFGGFFILFFVLNSNAFALQQRLLNFRGDFLIINKSDIKNSSGVMGEFVPRFRVWKGFGLGANVGLFPFEDEDTNKKATATEFDGIAFLRIVPKLELEAGIGVQNWNGRGYESLVTGGATYVFSDHRFFRGLYFGVSRFNGYTTSTSSIQYKLGLTFGF